MLQALKLDRVIGSLPMLEDLEVRQSFTLL
jgi:hypothetical protein